MATINLSVLKTRQTAKGSYIIYVSINHKRETRDIVQIIKLPPYPNLIKGKLSVENRRKIQKTPINNDRGVSNYPTRTTTRELQKVYILEDVCGKNQFSQNA